MVNHLKGERERERKIIIAISIKNHFTLFIYDETASTNKSLSSGDDKTKLLSIE